MQQQHLMIELNEDVEQNVLQLPSATTPSERKLALHYLSNIWEGQGSVFENGPLLGGSTRALAMGMFFNEARSPGSLLHTYDWFSLDQPLDLPGDVWIHLTQAGLLTMGEVNAAFEAKSFLPLFESLHRDQSYSDLVRPHVGYLPGHRGDVPPGGEAIFEAPDEDFSLAFIDGCKSWYGTKHWFREVVPHLRPGTDVMYQDFGHYTCFWLPMLVGLFRERWELRGYVDYTYIWRLLDPPSPEEVDATFPDEPTDLTNDQYDEVLSRLYSEAIVREDRRAVLLTQMQRAAAFAYLGLLDDSRGILDKLLSQAEWIPHRDYLKAARVSPTYTPEERIEL